MLCSTPILMVMAGPNGSGKSTITAGYQTIGEYVNADDIQNHLSCDALKAAIITTNTREYLLSQQKDFTFETLLSTERNYDLMQRAKEMGYRVICIYVLTIDPKINISRVEQRKTKVDIMYHLKRLRSASIVQCHCFLNFLMFVTNVMFMTILRSVAVENPQ